MRSSVDIIANKFPHIETERLLLRMLDKRDLDTAFRLFNDEAVQKYLAPENRRTREQMRNTLQNLRRRWVERNFGLWRVSEKGDDAMIGYCGFQMFEQTGEAEILFAYFEEYWGKGFAAEAARACLRCGFEELSFAQIYAAAHPKNSASRRVLDKIGMVFEKKTTHYGLETATYSISLSDFKVSEGIYRLTYRADAQR